MAEGLLGAPARLLATFLATRLSGAVIVVGALMLLARELGGAIWILWAVVVALVILLLAHTLPRAWALGRQLQIVLRLAPFVRLLVLGLTPLTALLRRLNQGAARDDTAAETIFLSDDGLRFLFNVAEEESTIQDGEKEMIASIFAFSDKLVREVMVPRIDVAAVSVDVPMTDALGVILKDGHSRIPVYRDSIDNIVGILNAKDLLRYLRDGRTDVPLGRILRTAYFIPESKKVDELLQELQQRRVHMAVVVDEYGGTAGIVTIEDLLEEIVGEIQDEYDAEEPTIEAVNEDEYLFDARVPLDEARKRLGVELPEEGGDTLGGFIYSQLGRVPAVADRIEYGDTVFEVLSVAGRRIKQVRVSRHVTELASQGESDATNERAGESTNQRIGESANQRISESARQPVFARA
jgi:CBS domain containing-hemolysin-like protein